MVVDLPPSCAACGWVLCAGTISYGRNLAEPHCARCLQLWVEEMLLVKRTGVGSLTLSYFRQWQEKRQQVCGFQTCGKLRVA